MHLARSNFGLTILQSLWNNPCGNSFPCIDVIAYSDASSSGWAGYVVQPGSLVARGEWDDLDFLQSSTYRELKAVRLTLESFACHLTSKECKHRSDNQGAISIMCIGSLKEHLQCEATKIYAICRKYGIRLFPEWVPRHLNTKADYWSCIIELDDWMLNPIHFQELDSLWGPHTVDQFASLNSKQLPRFCAKWQCPGGEGVDAFTLDWRGRTTGLFHLCI